MTEKTITAVMNENDGFELTAAEGFTGEHNAAILKVKLNESFASPEWDYIALVFNTCAPGGCFSSNAVRDENSSPVKREGDFIICPLGEELTRTGTLFVQAAAYKTEEQLCRAVRKSDIFSVAFKPSITGCGAFLTGEAGFENEVRAVVEAFKAYSGSFENIHTHENREVLDSLSEREGGLCYKGTEVGAYTLPTASLLEKGGVKPGCGLEMSGEYMGVSVDFMRICAAYTACRMSSDRSILHIVAGSPAEFDYIDADTPGISEYLYEMDDTFTKVCCVPTCDGDIEWVDLFDRLHSLSLRGGSIYVFEYDPQTASISVSVKSPDEM